MSVPRTLLRRVFAVLLVASTFNGALAHAAMIAAFAASAPAAVHNRVDHKTNQALCVTGPRSLACPLCTLSCAGAGVGLPAEAAAPVDVAVSVPASTVVIGLSGVRPLRDHPIRAPPRPLFQS